MQYTLMYFKGQLKKVRDRGERQRLYGDIKTLRRELRQRESAAVSDILTRASVVLATLTTASADGPLSCLNQQMFDIVVVDECSQVTNDIIDNDNTCLLLW